MKIYLFDIDTKRYLKEGKALYNPENPSNPHIPAYGTIIKPPECSECEAPYFENGEWKIRACYYGKKAVNVRSKVVETVYYDGDLKEGWQYVDDDTAKEIASNPGLYKSVDNQLVRLSAEEYAEYSAKEKKEHEIEQIKAQLLLLDTEAIRPLRAILAGTQTDEDLAKIKEIEIKANELRSQLATLQ